MKKSFLIVLIVLIFCTLCACDNSATDAIKSADDQTVNIIAPTVTFETNGGSKVNSQSTKVIKKEPQTTRENYLFDGWYFDKSFKTLAVFPLSVEYDTILYAKWLKIYDTATAKNTSISGKSGYDAKVSYNVSPPDFDLNALAERNLKLKITVSYDVTYQKKYDALWDIGYAGAPHYEVYLLGEDLKGAWEEDIVASKSSKTHTLSMATTADYFRNNIIRLTFSTNNIQNVVQIKNIVITYECGK
ncbi:MAG: InlB B-repeat-containing protein [Clostridia bacterium]|nr:InlB B-repeat-containing protein [Clostridia bacterium]